MDLPPPQPTPGLSTSVELRQTDHAGRLLGMTSGYCPTLSLTVELSRDLVSPSTGRETDKRGGSGSPSTPGARGGRSLGSDVFPEGLGHDDLLDGMLDSENGIMDTENLSNILFNDASPAELSPGGLPGRTTSPEYGGWPQDQGQQQAFPPEGHWRHGAMAAHGYEPQQPPRSYLPPHANSKGTAGRRGSRRGRKEMSAQAGSVTGVKQEDNDDTMQQTGNANAGSDLPRHLNIGIGNTFMNPKGAAKVRQCPT